MLYASIHWTAHQISTVWYRLGASFPFIGRVRFNLLENVYFENLNRMVFFRTEKVPKAHRMYQTPFSRVIKLWQLAMLCMDLQP